MMPLADEMMIEVCCECNIRFGLPASFLIKAQNNSKVWFFCPNGHRQHYPGAEMPIDRLRRELDALRGRLDSEEIRRRHTEKVKDSTKRQAAALKGVITKMKKRAAPSEGVV